MEQLDVNLNLSGTGGMEYDDTGVQPSLNISDVIEVIQTTDPEFVDVSMMFPGGVAGTDEDRKRAAYVKILEQPASKALRFRYECEGRSAGSIPGVSSSAENKTFPSIQIMGYKGRAVVVVSCVTKDPPYRPHPHNLVGKEGCKKGVCTMEISSESMAATFSNLGIQCVKKKDIEEALRVREEIRVDPYRTGFSHRSQPTSIDLNAVRLCFQVFLEGAERGKFTFQLAPIVSEPIYDKKAMSDLVICKLSDCTATVAGGKEIILLCEKVAKEDIQVRFFEERDGQVVWEGLGEFQPTQVHKQVAISFRTPRYRSLEVDGPVRACIQLRRPSDGITSEPLPFELLPLDSGRPAGFWSMRKALAANKGNYNVFASILASNTALLTGKARPEPARERPVVEVTVEEDEVEQSEDVENNNVEEDVVMEDAPPRHEYDYAEVNKWPADESADEPCLNELLSQVAELDEIYAENQTRLSEAPAPEEAYDDSQPYSSMQLAMKNPVHYTSPVISVKRETSEDAKLPPLPPKRIRRSPPAPPARPGELVGPPNKTLPDTPVPSKPSKPGLFSKLFSKRVKKEASTPAATTPRGSVGDVSLQTPAELTEAEHYALYTDVAPHATASEFDEMSFYYSPVEGGKILPQESRSPIPASYT